MLSWSSLDIGTRVDLVALAAGAGSTGVPLDRELLAFATAAVDPISPPPSPPPAMASSHAMDEARRALVAASDVVTMIDAAAVAANFHMMTRLADGTGARYPAERQTAMADAITSMGADAMGSRR